MRLARLREWWMLHLPPQFWPFSPWGAKGRSDMPERHQVANELTALRLRVDRLRQADEQRHEQLLDQLRRERQARDRLDAWEERGTPDA